MLALLKKQGSYQEAATKVAIVTIENRMCRKGQKSFPPLGVLKASG
jgi:hypothetical protein